MADIELVIKISEKVYNALTHIEFDANLVTDEMRESIENGTLIPKGHGALKDADEMKKRMGNLDGFGMIGRCIDEFPTIIEADQDEEE